MAMANNPGTVGKLAEDYVAQQLAGQGFTIAARNYHSRFGEIDLIAQGQGMLLFIEVKARKIGSMVSPMEAVTAAKQRKLLLTARQYLAEHPADGMQPRFDVAAVYMQAGGIVKIEYLENAFFA